MILTKIVKLKINIKNIDNLRSNGYENLELNNIIEINTEHLSSGSHTKIEVKCDVCTNTRFIMYKEYMRSLKNKGYYSCKGSCSSGKNKLTCIEKYGLDNPSKIEEFKNKKKETSMLRLGVDSPFKSIDIREKIKSVLIEKYGIDNPSKSIEFLNKKKSTLMKRYNVECYFSSDDFKEKSKKTNIEKYGVEHPMMNKSEVLKRLTKKGLSPETNEYRIYQNKVYNLTRKNKKQLIEEWDGFDYYDNEFIIENFKLDPLSSDYPTIDHKLPIYEGFKNNIDPFELSSIENLCITKRKINSSKHNKVDWSYLIGQ